MKLQKGNNHLGLKDSKQATQINKLMKTIFMEIDVKLIVKAQSLSY